MYMYEFGCGNDIMPRLSISVVFVLSKFAPSSIATTDMRGRVVIRERGCIERGHLTITGRVGSEAKYLSVTKKGKGLYPIRIRRHQHHPAKLLSTTSVHTGTARLIATSYISVRPARARRQVRRMSGSAFRGSKGISLSTLGLCCRMLGRQRGKRRSFIPLPDCDCSPSPW